MCCTNHWKLFYPPFHNADSSDTIIFANTINFDASIIQALPPLTIGAGLVVAKPEGHLDASYIVQLVLEHQVTGFICTVPTLVSLLARK